MGGAAASPETARCIAGCSGCRTVLRSLTSVNNPRRADRSYMESWWPMFTTAATLGTEFRDCTARITRSSREARMDQWFCFSPLPRNSKFNPGWRGLVRHCLIAPWQRSMAWRSSLELAGRA